MKRPSPFVIAKISDHGTRNPIVARLSIQTIDLLQWCGLPKEKKEDLQEIYIYNLSAGLLRCHDAVERLTDARNVEIQKAISEAQRENNTFVPYIRTLDAELNTFLYEAKNYLRDATAVLNIFYGTAFNEASHFLPARSKKKDKTVVDWANDKLGPDSDLAQWLADRRTWLDDIISLRNALEHPGGHSGNLIKENFRTSPNGLIAPTWRREGDSSRTASYVFEDLPRMMDFLLSFGEELLVLCLPSKPIHPNLEPIISEIPPDRRDPACPVRFVGTVDISAVVQQPSVAEQHEQGGES